MYLGLETRLEPLLHRRALISLIPVPNACHGRLWSL